MTKRKKNLEAQKLTNITRGMQHAASTTSAMLAQQYIYLMDQFFDRQEDGSVKAKMARVNIDKDHYMMLPLVSLVAPKGISLHKLHVQMSVKMSEAEIRKATHFADDSKAERTSFRVSLSPKGRFGETIRRSDVVDIDMEFHAGDPPEGIMRIIEQYTNMIAPINRKNQEPPADIVDLKVPGEEKGEETEEGQEGKE